MKDNLQEQYRIEIKGFLKAFCDDISGNYKDIYNYINIDDKNQFYNEYKKDLYDYMRISTKTTQEFGRQVLELYEFLKKKNISININNIFCDKYTGKSLKRKGYEELKNTIKSNDYLIISEVSRLGRNWDDTKKEWYRLKGEDINLLVMDYELLNTLMNVDRKFMQENIFNGMLYVACKKIEEVSRSTKDGLKAAAAKGHFPGRPSGNKTTLENFIKVLKLQLYESYKYEQACYKVGFPPSTFTLWLNKYKKMYNIENKESLYNILIGGKENGR